MSHNGKIFFYNARKRTQNDGLVTGNSCLDRFSCHQLPGTSDSLESDRGLLSPGGSGWDPLESPVHTVGALLNVTTHTNAQHRRRATFPT
jgi:hypothetical protein